MYSSKTENPVHFLIPKTKLKSCESNDVNQSGPVSSLTTAGMTPGGHQPQPPHTVALLRRRREGKLVGR
jgi:uncharacterized OB-fold protein